MFAPLLFTCILGNALIFSRMIETITCSCIVDNVYAQDLRNLEQLNIIL